MLVTKYLVNKEGGLTLSPGTVLDKSDKSTLVVWSAAYFETWNLRA